MWDRGARSPLAPRDPFSGMTGWTPRFSICKSVSMVERRMPELPRARAFSRSSMAARTTRVSRGSPMPQAWEMIRFLCSWAVSSSGTNTVENLPNPVVRPYTTALSASFRST